MLPDRKSLIVGLSIGILSYTLGSCHSGAAESGQTIHTFHTERKDIGEVRKDVTGPDQCSYTAPITQSLPQQKTQFEDKYAFYPRVIRLEHSGERNGALVAVVVRKNSAGHWVGHLKQSTDGGLTFSTLGDVVDPMAVEGMCCHTLFELPLDVGEMPAGTLLWAASFSAHPENRRMSQRVWQSQDGGRSWSFLSTISTSTSTKGAWEPEFTISADGQLVVFYSDETDPAHSQKIVAWRSMDGVNWRDFQDVLALEKPALRPGMPVVRKTPDGNWLMAYEICSSDRSTVCEIYVRSSSDGWDWGDPADSGERVLLADGQFPASTPTLTVSGNNVLLRGMRQRNANGSFAAGDGKSIFANVNNGKGRWFEIPAPVTMEDPGKGSQKPGYSNPLLGSLDGKSVLLLATDYGPSGTLHAYHASGAVAPKGNMSASESTQLLNSSGVLSYFARSPAGGIKRWYAGGPATPWGPEDADLIGVPLGIGAGDKEYVFGRSSKGALVRWTSDSTEIWATGIVSDPAVLVVGDAQHVWATDPDGALRHWWWSERQGLKEDKWAEGVVSTPSVVLSKNSQHVFARTKYGELLHVWWNSAQGKQREIVEAGRVDAECKPFPALASAPVAAILGQAQHVWFIDTQGQLQHLWWNPGQAWSYETWGKGLVGRPAFMRVGDAQHVFARSNRGTLEHWWWSPTQGLRHDTWSAELEIAGDPVAVLNGKKQEVFALDSSGALQHFSWTSKSGVVHRNWGR